MFADNRVICAILASMAGSAAYAGQMVGPEALLDKLISGKADERVAALTALEKQRSREEVRLVSAAKAVLAAAKGKEVSRGSEAFVLARALGVIRAGEAAHVLAEYLGSGDILHNLRGR